jgi:hypothetical protein
MTTATAVKPNRMTLANVHRGKNLEKPDRILLYGTEGIGKSTFGASAPDPIFIASEDGIKHLDVSSFPEPGSLDDVLAAIRELRQSDHDRKTLVIDTVDWVEPLVFAEVISRGRDWKNIEDVGYGKGYSIALDGWRKMLTDLDSLRAERGMEIILLAHAQTSNFNNPAGPDYSRYELAMNKRGAGLLKQWADSELFACYEEVVQKEKGALRAKGQATGARVIHTAHCAAWDAKNRYSLPPVLPLSYEDYAAHRAARQTETPENLSMTLDELLIELNPNADLRFKILAFVGNRKDATKLAQAVNRVRALLQEKVQ